MTVIHRSDFWNIYDRTHVVEKDWPCGGRKCREYGRAGVALTRQTLSNWGAAVAGCAGGVPPKFEPFFMRVRVWRVGWFVGGFLG